MNWYCRHQDAYIGPLTAAQLKQLAGEGKIDETTLVRQESESRWWPATRIEGLLPATAGAPHPAAPRSGDRTAVPPNGPALLAVPVPPVTTPADSPVTADRPPPPTPTPRPLSLSILGWCTLVVGGLALLNPLVVTVGQMSARLREVFQVPAVPLWLIALSGVLLGAAYLAAGIGILRGAKGAPLLCLAVTVLHGLSNTILVVRAPLLALAGLLIALAVEGFFLFRAPAATFFRARSAYGLATGKGSRLLAGITAGLIGWMYSYEFGWLENPDRPGLPTATAGSASAEASTTAGHAGPPAPAGRKESPAEQHLRQTLEEVDRQAYRARIHAPHSPPPVPYDPQAPLAPETRILGRGFDPLFRAVVPSGAWLVGMEVGLAEPSDHDHVRAVRPIFRTGTKESFGEQYGDRWVRVLEAKAKPGYAVGGLSVNASLTAEGFSLIYMRIVGDRLDPSDSYQSEWLGARREGHAPQPVGGDGRPVRGLLLHLSPLGGLTGVGLIFDPGRSTPVLPRLETVRMGLRPSPADPLRDVHPAHDWSARTAQPGLNHTPVLGGHEGRHPVYSDLAPAADGVLVGFEFGKFENKGVYYLVRAVRPIYRVGDREIPGDRHGIAWTSVVRVVARPEYAVSAVQIRSGWDIEGIRVVFSRMKDGKLDVYDSYESDPVGHTDGPTLKSLTGRGRPVVGIVYAMEKNLVSGLGLVLAPPP